MMRTTSSRRSVQVVKLQRRAFGARLLADELEAGCEIPASPALDEAEWINEATSLGTLDQSMAPSTVAELYLPAISRSSTSNTSVEPPGMVGGRP